MVSTVIIALVFILVTASTAAAATLTLDTVMARALAHAQELQIANVDMEISKYSLEEVRSLYFPSLTARFDTEYLHVYDENEINQVSVGDYVSTNLDSAYQNAFTLRLTYDLYQFGVRPLKFENAKRDVRIADFYRSQETLELQLAVLDIYRQGLILQKKREATADILGQVHGMIHHLLPAEFAGLLQPLSVSEYLFVAIEDVSRVDQLDSAYEELLSALERYTGVAYTPAETRFAGFTDIATAAELPDARTHPEILAIEEEIRKKENEYAIARKEMLPRFYFSGAHRMFGRDDANYVDALKNIKGRDASFAVYAEWNLFSGFRDVSRGQRLKLEVARMRLERDKRLAEIEAQIKGLYQTVRLNRERSENRSIRAVRLGASRENLERLSAQQIVDRIGSLQKEIELIEQRLDLDIQETEQAAAEMELVLFQEGSTP